jgi:hypothetical protein
LLPAWHGQDACMYKASSHLPSRFT